MKPKINYRETFFGSVEDAMAYGDREAILLAHIRFWVNTNKRNRNNVHPDKNGNLRYWTYNSKQAMMEWFPYWNEHRIRRLLESLEKQGAILVDSFNQNRFDNTSWYTIDDSSSLVQVPKSKRDVECVE